MTKYVGGLLLLLYGVMVYTGYEPFAGGRRGSVPAGTRRAPGGTFLWWGGLHGGK
jgi:hypothetical protein